MKQFERYFTFKDKSSRRERLRKQKGKEGW